MVVRRPKRLASRVLALLALSSALGCFRGGEREKEAPAGLLGGKCLAPPAGSDAPYCEEGTCNDSRNYCFDPQDPCEGFFCGGSERGFCQADAEFLPMCVCDIGFNTQTYDLYCCPDAGSPVVDPRCGAAADDGDSGAGDSAPATDDSGGMTTDGGSGSGTG